MFDLSFGWGAIDGLPFIIPLAFIEGSFLLILPNSLWLLALSVACNHMGKRRLVIFMSIFIIKELEHNNGAFDHLKSSSSAAPFDMKIFFRTLRSALGSLYFHNAPLGVRFFCQVRG